jgi:hypothetical protein
MSIRYIPIELEIKDTRVFYIRFVFRCTTEITLERQINDSVLW